MSCCCWNDDVGDAIDCNSINPCDSWWKLKTGRHLHFFHFYQLPGSPTLLFFLHSSLLFNISTNINIDLSHRFLHTLASSLLYFGCSLLPFCFCPQTQKLSHLCHPPNYSLPFCMFAFPFHSCEYFYEPNIFWKPIWPTDHWTLDTSCLPQSQPQKH